MDREMVRLLDKINLIHEDISHVAELTVDVGIINSTAAQSNQLVLVQIAQTLTSIEQTLIRMEQKRRSRLSTVALVVSIFAFVITVVRAIALLT